MEKSEFDVAMKKILTQFGLNFSAPSNGFLPELWKGLVKICVTKGKEYVLFCPKCGYTRKQSYTMGDKDVGRC